MGKVSPDRYRGDASSPPLEPEVLGSGVNAAVLTIHDFREAEIGDRVAPLLEIAEYPDYAFWLNVRDVRTLIEKFGDETEEWIGQQVPVVRQRVQDPSTKEYKEKLHVARASAWQEIFDEFAKVSKSRSKRKRSR